MRTAYLPASSHSWNLKRNKKDERVIVVRNKARLVAQGHKQKEGIDYDEVFTPMARIEAIRILLAFASFMGFIIYQMDIKSAFLYGTIKEQVYVSQPPSFIDPQFPNKVYKVEKALYGLHQAPRAWYETLSTFMLQNRYRRGIIDKTLFIKKEKDDIIFRSTKKSLCDEYEALMHKRLQMSSIGELTFFLGLQVKQSEEEIFISQDKYLKGQSKLGLWYHRDSPFDLEAYSDNDYAEANLDRKSTTEEPLNDVYVTPTLTKKVFSNMIRKSKEFSGTVTPLFATMLAPPVVVEGEGKGSGSGLGGQETIGDAMAQIRYECALIQSIDPPLSTGGHTPGSDEGSITLKELTNLCTTLLQKVFVLENDKTTQAKEIASLKKRVTKLDDIC
nr:copia protein [Tanacetum cinerariifolium]